MEILTLTLALSTILALLLFWREYRSRSKPTSNNPYLNKATDDYNEVLHSAITRGQEILSEAETQALKNTADAQFYKDKLNKTVEENLNNALSEAETEFATKLKTLEQEYEAFFAQAKLKTLDSSKKYETSMDELMKVINEKMEANLNKFIQDTQKQSFQQIQMELNAARQLVDNYKAGQMRLVDENIIAVLERTLALVLNKNISLENQIDLVYEAYDRAKKEKFFV